MQANSSLTVLTALCLLMPLSSFASSPAKRAEAPAAAIDPQALARVVPGISKAQVKSLLGEPWRTVQYNDLDEIENEFWEYRGQDSQGTYRLSVCQSV